MKTYFPIIALSALICSATPAFAQTHEPVTREQIHSELLRLQYVGYNSAFENITYPSGLQAAQKKIKRAETGFDSWG